MIVGAEVKDTLSGKSTQVYAKQVINATGPFTDSLRQMSDPSKPSIIMPSAGLILPAACSMLAVPMVINIIAHSAQEHHVYAVSMSQHGDILYQCHSMAIYCSHVTAWLAVGKVQNVHIILFYAFT